jgi:hypothetical protein
MSFGDTKKKAVPAGNGFFIDKEIFFVSFPTLVLPRSGSTGIISGESCHPE